MSVRKFTVRFVMTKQSNPALLPGEVIGPLVASCNFTVYERSVEHAISQARKLLPVESIIEMPTKKHIVSFSWTCVSAYEELV